MATYQSICVKCAKIHIYSSHICERDQKAPTCICGGQTVRKITPPMVTVIGKAAG